MDSKNHKDHGILGFLRFKGVYDIKNDFQVFETSFLRILAFFH